MKIKLLFLTRIGFTFLSIYYFGSPHCLAYAPLDSIGTTKVNGKIHTRYLVSPGETIYGISTKHHVPISDLMEINPELENGLKVGQVINIPYFSAATTEAAGKNQFANVPSDKQDLKVSNVLPHKNNSGSENKIIHKVQSGETLYSLSRKYNVSVNDLMKWNNLELKVGQEVVVMPGNNTSAPNPVTASSVSSNSSETDTKKGNIVASKNSDKIEFNKGKEIVKTITGTTERYDFDSARQQILIIPFDPYLYFSDADDEIAATSKIPRTKVRQSFRRRMNSLLDHPAYENIHLLGGRSQDSLTDLNKIYSSVTYNYQEILYSPNDLEKQKQSESELINKPNSKQNAKAWLAKQKEKIKPDEASSKAITAKDNGKYFGVLIKNPDLFNYFNYKYDIDYYIFVNQFEVKTNYENCLDRAAQNYERTFTTHYSIFDSKGKQIAGNRFNTHYNSNSNHIDRILSDNVQKIADKILAELPSPKK